MNYQEILEHWHELHYSETLVKAVIENPHLYLPSEIDITDKSLELHKRRLDIRFFVVGKDRVKTKVSFAHVVMSSEEIDKFVKRAEAHMIARKLERTKRLHNASVVWAILTDTPPKEGWNVPEIRREKLK